MQAVQLNRDRDKFEHAGVDLMLIGQGEPKDAARFRKRHQIELPMLTDRKRESYRGTGAKMATVGELLGPQVVARGIRKAMREHVVQGPTRGHPAQLGGILIVTPGGQIAWSHLAEDASDNPRTEELLDAARAAAGYSSHDPSATQ